MSFRVVARVIATDLKPTGTKLTLMVLAEACNDDGSSLFLAMAEIARRVSVSIAQAQRHMHSLITKGFISVTANANGGAPGTTRHYQINLAMLGELVSKRGRTNATGSTDATGGTAAVVGLLERGPGVATVRATGRIGATQTTKTLQGPAIDPLDERFERFWMEYPRKEAKDTARAEFAKRNPDAELFNTMLNAVRQQTRSERWQQEGGRYIPHPGRWLSGGRWQDEFIGSKPVEWYETRPGTEKRAAELGLPGWSQTVPFTEYRAQVKAADAASRTSSTRE